MELALHRVLLAMPPDVLRSAFAAELKGAGLTVTTSGGSAQRVVSRITEAKCAAVVVAATQFGMAGSHWKTLVDAAHPAPLLLVIEDPEDPRLLDALHAGCRGAILAGHPERCANAVRTAVGGAVALPRASTAALVSELMRQKQLLDGVGPVGQLTAREREVLHLLQLGYSTSEIAHRLVPFCSNRNTDPTDGTKMLSKPG